MNLIIPIDNKMYFFAVHLWAKVEEAASVLFLYIFLCILSRNSYPTKLI